MYVSVALNRLSLSSPLVCIFLSNPPSNRKKPHLGIQSSEDFPQTSATREVSWGSPRGQHHQHRPYVLHVCVCVCVYMCVFVCVWVGVFVWVCVYPCVREYVRALRPPDCV